MKRFSRQTDIDSMTMPTRQLRGKRLSAELSLTLTHLSQAPVSNTCYHVKTVSSFIRKHAFSFSDNDWRMIFKALYEEARTNYADLTEQLPLHIRVYELWHRADNRYAAKTQLQAVALHRELLRRHKNTEKSDVIKSLEKEIFEIWNRSSITTMLIVVIHITWNAFFNPDF